MATEQTYTLDGPTEFFFPFPVRTAGEVVVELVPGGVLPSSEYEVIGASATATGITIRYPNAPRDGNTDLTITRVTNVDRVSIFLDDLSITATALNAEFDNFLAIIQDGIVNEYRGDWATNQLYFELDVVLGPDDNIYVATEQHTSDVFNTDFNTEGYWRLIADFAAGQQAIDTALNEAEAARDKAEEWAENPEDVEVETGQFSALHYAAKADDSAAAALQSEQNAAPVNAIVTEIQTVAGIETQVVTVAGIDTDVTTVSSISSDVTTVAADGTDIGTVSTNIADINTVAGISTDVSSVAAIDSDITSVAADGTDIGTVATNISDVNAVAGISTDITTVVSLQSEIVDVSQSTDAVDIIASDLAGAGFDYDLGTITAVTEGVLGTPNGYIITLFNIRDDIISVSDISSNVTTVANNIAGVNTIAADITDVNTVAGISTEVTAVSTISGDITTVSNVSTDITTVAGITSNITTVAGINSDVTSVAGISTDIPTVAAIDTEVVTAANNIIAIQNAPQAATDAANAKDKAENWAQEAEDVEVEPGLFSAFHWAQKAQDFAEGDAANIGYDNITSGLSATDVQAAIDELETLKANLDGGNNFTGNQTVTGDVTITGTLDCGSIA
ncbi:MAG TPA: hypothetical protein VKP88_08765 [Candidatus Paceibacterota bacterium]|nr:hypothetical protein [Candidatus Paceibacterota bacterium]